MQATCSKGILVVDDDRLVLATLAQALRDAGYAVTEAGSGKEALQCAASTHIDLAVVDMRMPEMTGAELARRLLSEHRIPSLMLSAYGDPDSVRSAVEEGSLGYLVKPIDPPRILPSVEAAIARAAELRALREINQQLNTALAKGRETSIAVGVVMERHALDREQAFGLLRERARSQRRKIDQLAADLLKAVEDLNLRGKDV